MTVAGGDSQSMTATMNLAEMAAESRRRQEAAATGGASTLDDGTTCSRPFQTDDQLVFLYNIANVNQRPRALRPAVRLLGLFPSAEDAVAHGREIAALDPRSDIRLGATHAWYVIAKDGYTDNEPYRLKVNRNLELHQKALSDYTSEFVKRKKHLTKGRIPSYHPLKAQQQTEERRKLLQDWADAADEGGVDALRQKDAEYAARIEAEQVQRSLAANGEEGEEGVEESKSAVAEVDDYEEPELAPFVSPEQLDETWRQEVEALWGGEQFVPVTKLGRAAEVRNQRYAVISVLHDYEGEGVEPGFIVWGAFDSEEDALKYNKCVAAKQLKEHDLAIVAMYEWIYPHLINSDQVEQLYRNQELHNIMKNRRLTAKRVSDFQRECADKGLNMPVTEVDADLDTAAPTVYTPLITETATGMGEEEDPLA
jgi:hypothetical protein